MPTTVGRRALPVPIEADGPDVPRDITNLANAIQNLAVYNRGTLASMPSTGNFVGDFYRAYDDLQDGPNGTLYEWTGSAWAKTNQSGSSSFTGSLTLLGASAAIKFDRQDSPGAIWSWYAFGGVSDTARLNRQGVGDLLTIGNDGALTAGTIISKSTSAGQVRMIPNIGENWIESGNDVWSAEQDLSIGGWATSLLGTLKLHATHTQIDGYTSVTGGYGALPSSIGHLAVGANGGSSNAGSICWGDGTGWRMSFGADIAGAFTETFTFDDRGFFQAWTSTAGTTRAAVEGILGAVAGNTGQALKATSFQAPGTGYWLYYGQVLSNTWVGGHRGDGVLFATSSSVSTTSDARLKTNVRDLEAGLEVIKALRPRIFDWTDEAPQAGKKDDIGFIAQEAEPHVPHLVDSVLIRPDAEFEHKTFAPGGLVPFLVNAVQELAERVESLEAQLAAK